MRPARTWRWMQVLAEDLEAASASAEDLSWALCCVHSRSFVVGGSGGILTHVVAPGIDMANHSFQPTAGVRSCSSQRKSTACQVGPTETEVDGVQD